MEERRVYLSAEHHARRGKSFALLVILGLVVVVSVWFLQLRTLFTRGDVAEVNEHIASFQRGLQAEWDALAQEEQRERADVSVVSTAADAVEAFVEEELRNEQARDAVAAEVAEALGDTAAQVVEEAPADAALLLPEIVPPSPNQLVTE